MKVITNWLFFILCMINLSCKNDAKISPQLIELDSLQSAYISQPSDQKFEELMVKYGEIISIESDLEIKTTLLKRAVKFCKDNNKPEFINGFALELIKLNPKDNDAQTSVWELGNQMEKNGKNDIAGILYQGYINMYPNHENAGKAKGLIPSELSDIHRFIKGKAEQVFVNPGERGINNENARHYIDICEAYALVNQQDTMSSLYLFRASEMSRALGSLNKTISLYDWIITYYPNDKNASMALFLKGFTYENEIKDLEKAKEIYETFLSKYPNHAMAKDVGFLIKNIGKSDKEIMDALQENRTSQEKK